MNRRQWGRLVSAVGAWWSLAWCVELSACFTNITELSMDVITDGENVRIFFTEVARPD